MKRDENGNVQLAKMTQQESAPDVTD